MIPSPALLLRLDEMLGSEVRPQVQDLPPPDADEQEGGAEAEPLDSVVGALVGVAQLLLAGAQVVHLGDDLGHELLDPAQLRLDGLQLLARLDGSPILGIGANIDVEFDVTNRVLDVSGWRRVRIER